MADVSAVTPTSGDNLEAEMRRLELSMHLLAYDDPERQSVVRQYNAVCRKLKVPNGDK